MKGKLYLVPTPLSDDAVESVLTEHVLGIIRGLHYFIVEEIRTARRFLKKVNPAIDFEGTRFFIYNEHTGETDTTSYLEPLSEGHDVGLLSEAGLPCIADPGSLLVDQAHSKGIKVIPLTGPSSIFLALMASGFPGQNFIFHGYLPVDRNERAKKLRAIEKTSMDEDQVQIFIETPYRNMQLFEAIVSACKPSTRLCIASGLTGSGELIMQMTMKEWKGKVPDIHRKPAVFLIYSR